MLTIRINNIRILIRFQIIRIPNSNYQINNLIKINTILL